MEDTLRGQRSNCRGLFQGLNPCFNGRYSQRIYNFINNKEYEKS